MRFMIIKATGPEGGAMPDERLLDMASTTRSCRRPALPTLRGCSRAPRAGASADGGKRTVIDGLAESKELVAGYTIIEVKTRRRR
jgi:hypothetical protein